MIGTLAVEQVPAKMELDTLWGMLVIVETVGATKMRAEVDCVVRVTTLCSQVEGSAGLVSGPVSGVLRTASQIAPTVLWMHA